MICLRQAIPLYLELMSKVVGRYPLDNLYLSIVRELGIEGQVTRSYSVFADVVDKFVSDIRYKRDEKWIRDQMKLKREALVGNVATVASSLEHLYRKEIAEINNRSGKYAAFGGGVEVSKELMAVLDAARRASGEVLEKWGFYIDGWLQYENLNAVAHGSASFNMHAIAASVSAAFHRPIQWEVEKYDEVVELSPIAVPVTDEDLLAEKLDMYRRAAAVSRWKEQFGVIVGVERSWNLYEVTALPVLNRFCAERLAEVAEKYEALASLAQDEVKKLTNAEEIGELNMAALAAIKDLGAIAGKSYQAIDTAAFRMEQQTGEEAEEAQQVAMDIRAYQKKLQRLEEMFRVHAD